MSYEAALLTLAIAAPVALLVAYFDLKTMTIPNWLSLGAAAIFGVLVLLTLPFTDALWRFAGGGIVLAVTFTLFAVGGIGGGDAKIAPGFALLIAPMDAASFLVILSVCAVLSILLIVIVRATPLAGLARGGSWKVWSESESGRSFLKVGVPYGVALGAALIIYLALVVRTVA